MLSVKKLLYKVCNYLNNIIVIENRTLSSSLVVGANTTATASASVTKSGYTPIGVIGTSRGGAGSGLLADASAYVNTATEIANVQLYNPTSTQRTVSVTAMILYLKKVGGGYCVTSVFSRLSSILCYHRKVVA